MFEVDLVGVTPLRVLPWDDKSLSTGETMDAKTTAVSNRYAGAARRSQTHSATEMEANEQLAMLPATPKVFFWTDAERKCPEGWGFIASVRQGVPPSGIEAELNAWADQYPKAWLAVDLRDGVVPPSTVRPLNEVLAGLKRPVIVIVSRSPEHEEWPQWVLPA